MNTMIESLRGKKTYLAAAMGAVYVLGALAGLWEWDEKIVALFFAGGLASLRAGVARNGSMMLVAMATLTGCSTPERTAYQATGTVAVTVDAAMLGWGDYVRAGRATPEDEALVKAAYQHYQAAMRTARAVTWSYLDAGGADRGPLLDAIDALDASKNELVTLIETFIHPAP
jgi:hypothetical protein